MSKIVDIKLETPFIGYNEIKYKHFLRLSLDFDLHHTAKLLEFSRLRLDKP